MIETAKKIGLGYAITTAVLLTAFVGHAVVEKLTGYALVPRAHAAFEALVESAPASDADPDAAASAASLAGEGADGASASQDREGDPSDAKPAPFDGDVKKLALDLRRELLQTAGTIDSWESRLDDILVEDIRQTLESIRKENEQIRKLGENWTRIRESMIGILNEILRNRGVDRPLTADEFQHIVQGETQDAGGDDVRTIDELLRELRGDDEDFTERARELEELRAEVIAGILATEPEVADPLAARRFLSDEQAVALLRTMDAKKRGKVLTELQKENSEKAAVLLARFLNAGGRTES